MPRKGLPAWFLVLGVAGFLLYVCNFQNAFPSTSLSFKISRSKIESMAAELAARLGYTKDSKIKSTIFESDYSVLLFLQHNYGPKEADRLIKNGVPCFYWSSRFCSPGQLEEFTSSRTPDGMLVSISHNIPNDLALPSLGQNAGRKLINTFLLKEAEINPENFKLISFKSEKKKARNDLSYIFEEKQQDYKGARLRLDLVVSGDEITAFNRYLHTPDIWDLKYRSMFSYNQVLNMLFWVFHYILLGGAFLYFLKLLVQRTLRWRFALRAASLIAAFSALSTLVNVPTWLHRYSTENPEATFYLSLTMAMIGTVAMSFVCNVALFVPAEAIYRKLYGKGLLLNDLLSKSGIRSVNFRNGTILGLAACGVWQGWQNLYYWLGSYASISCPLDVDHPEIFGSYIPCFDLMSIGASASFTEELSYRVIVLLVAQRLCRNFWLANFLQAFVWSLGHTTYPCSPVWSRIIELTVGGLIAGIVFRTYGVLPFLVAHYLFDSFLPILFKAHDWQLVLSGAVAIMPPFALYLLSRYWSNAKTKEVPPAEPSQSIEPEVLGASPGSSRNSASAVSNASAANSLSIPCVPNRSADTQEAQQEDKLVRRIPSLAIVVSTSIVLLVSLVVIFNAKSDPLSLQVSPSEAKKMARDYIQKVGLDDPSLNLFFQRLSNDMDTAACQCLQDKLGKKRFRQIFQDTFMPQVWLVRFCGENGIKELDVQIDACRNRVIGLICKLPDNEKGAHLSKEDAIKEIEQFLRNCHKDIMPFKLVGTKFFERENRSDYTTQWECARFGSSDAKLMLECCTIGGTVSGFSQYWQLPDKWTWKYREFTVRRSIASFALVIEILLTMAGAIVWLLHVPKSHAPSFSWIGSFISVVAGFIVFAVVMIAPWIMSNYDAQTPFLTSMIRLFLWQAIIFIPILCLLGVILILASDVGQQFTPGDKDRKHPGKTISAIPANGSLLMSLCTGYTLGALGLLLLGGAIYLITMYSNEVIIIAYDIVAYYAQGYSPALLTIGLSLVLALVSIPIAGVVFGFCERYLKGKLRYMGAALIFSFSLSLLTRQSRDLFLLSALIFTGLLICRLAIYRVFRYDPLSCAAAVYSFMILGLVSQFIMLARSLLLTDACICVAALLLPLLGALFFKPSKYN